MVMTGKSKDTKLVICNCNCGCDEALQVKKFTYDDVSPNEQEYYISVLAGVFSERQRGVFRTIFHRINIAWKMLLGKEYLLSIFVNFLQSSKFSKKRLQNCMNSLHIKRRMLSGVIEGTTTVTR